MPFHFTSTSIYTQLLTIFIYLFIRFKMINGFILSKLELRFQLNLVTRFFSHWFWLWVLAGSLMAVRSFAVCSTFFIQSRSHSHPPHLGVLPNVCLFSIIFRHSEDGMVFRRSRSRRGCWTVNDKMTKLEAEWT